MSALITADRVAALNPCPDYSSEKLRSLLPQGRNVAGCLSLLLSLPHQDARWVLSRLLNDQGRIAWANGCAQRAKRYAASNIASADAAASAAAYEYAASRAAAAAAASYAARSAAYAAASAASAADAAAAAADAAYAAYAAYEYADAYAYAYAAARGAYAAARGAYAADSETKLQCVLGLELLAAGFIND